MALADLVVLTDRLRISKLCLADANFILELLNEPAFVRFIGDRDVRNTEDAGAYLRDGPLASYISNDFGLYKVSSRKDHDPLGICGLVRRSELDFPDLGFAFSQVRWGNGFAFESCKAVLRHAATELSLRRIVAIVHPDNTASLRLLEKLGFGFERMICMKGELEEVCQYSISLPEVQ